MLRLALLLLGLVGLGGCAATTDGTASGMPTVQRFAALEAKSGGRLGVALTDGSGRILTSYRADERFAMCSTFKLALAGMVLDRYGKGGPSLRMPLRFTRADIVFHHPVTGPLIEGKEEAEIRVGFAAEAAVTTSDNVAANLLLREYGGPEAFTAWLRDIGDSTTRLDRFETMLNENAPGDPRDTTTPTAMAGTMRTILLGDRLLPELRDMLLGWLVDSKTGLARIRQGLPADWWAGDKTGNCGTASNDIAIFRNGADEPFFLTVYLDRPTLDANGIDSVIAEAGSIAAEFAR